MWGDDIETSYGFSALPAGYYSEDGDEFLMIKAKTIFWSATESGTNAEAFYLTKGENSFVNAEYSKANMLSVRCLVENFK